jgi:hypothetical protein
VNHQAAHRGSTHCPHSHTALTDWPDAIGVCLGVISPNVVPANGMHHARTATIHVRVRAFTQHARRPGAVTKVCGAAQVLSPAQSAVLFLLAGDNWLVEPLHVTNLLALKHGLLQAPVERQLPPAHGGMSDAAPEPSQHSEAPAHPHELYTPSAPAQPAMQ